MKKILLGAILGTCLFHLVPPNQGFCVEENELGNQNAQVEDGLQELESWADEKSTGYIKRVSTIKHKLEDLLHDNRKIINDSASKRQDRKEAEARDADLRLLLALTRRTEEIIFKDSLPTIRQAFQDAYNQFDEGTLNDLEGLKEIESQITHLVGQIQGAYADLQDAVNESGLLTKTIQ